MASSKSTRVMTPDMTMDARVGSDNNSNTGVKKINTKATSVAVTIDEMVDVAPASLFTADREKLPVMGYPLNNPEHTLATPKEINSVLESIL